MAADGRSPDPRVCAVLCSIDASFPASSSDPDGLHVPPGPPTSRRNNTERLTFVTW